MEQKSKIKKIIFISFAVVILITSIVFLVVSITKKTKSPLILNEKFSIKSEIESSSTHKTTISGSLKNKTKQTYDNVLLNVVVKELSGGTKNLEYYFSIDALETKPIAEIFIDENWYTAIESVSIKIDGKTYELMSSKLNSYSFMFWGSLVITIISFILITVIFIVFAKHKEKMFISKADQLGEKINVNSKKQLNNWTCTYCGTDNKEGDVKCAGCGAKKSKSEKDAK